MVHPYLVYRDDTPIDEMDQIELNVSICTLFEGMPHGLAAIQYEDPDDKFESFTGIGVFNYGKLDNTPFTCLRGDGFGYSFSKMQNGRPANGSVYTMFNEDGWTQYTGSKKK